MHSCAPPHTPAHPGLIACCLWDAPPRPALHGVHAVLHLWGAWPGAESVSAVPPLHGGGMPRLMMMMWVVVRCTPAHRICGKYSRWHDVAQKLATAATGRQAAGTSMLSTVVNVLLLRISSMMGMMTMLVCQGNGKFKRKEERVRPSECSLRASDCLRPSIIPFS